MLSVVLWTVLAAVLAYQGLLTRHLWRSDLYERNQKIAQSVLLWLLPVAGAAIVYAGLRQQEDVSHPPNPLEGRGEGGGGQQSLDTWPTDFPE